MTWLFLRSAHAGEAERSAPLPPWEGQQDMWSSLFAAACKTAGATGVIVRVGEEATIDDGPVLIRRTAGVGRLVADVRPDVVIDRGGYREYAAAHDATPDAFRVYVGCGARWNPAAQEWTAGRHYDLVLVDTPEQAADVACDRPDSIVRVFHKPAAECFAPIECERTHDVVYVCNAPSERKGVRWLAERLPAGTSVIRIGPDDDWFRARADAGGLNVWFAGQLPRDEIATVACKARVGVVCDDGVKDSGPRVLPELLAMGLPVLLRDTVRTDASAYITPATGRVVGDDGVPGGLAELLAADNLDPRGHYMAGLTMQHAAGRLAQWITRGMELRGLTR